MHTLLENCRGLISLAFIACVFTSTYGQDLKKADLYRDYGLREDAKREYIRVIADGADPGLLGKAYYALGSIAFEESKITLALQTWTTLAEKAPDSPEAKLVATRIAELSQIVGKVERGSVDNAIAESYLKHADFWSREKEDGFTIDSSWIDHIDAASKWYDRVIAEFPKTEAAEIAYKGKLRTLAGWKESGQYGQAFGMQEDPIKYMPLVLSTFQAYEADFPDSPSLQGFRYSIAQHYWGMKDWTKTREWLKLVIEKSGGTDSFYSDLAKRRMEKVEY